jgi:hypothetical protein
MLRVATQRMTLRVILDAERPGGIPTRSVGTINPCTPQKLPTTPQILYWHSDTFHLWQKLDRFLQYLCYSAFGVKSLI